MVAAVAAPAILWVDCTSREPESAAMVTALPVAVVTAAVWSVTVVTSSVWEDVMFPSWTWPLRTWLSAVWLVATPVIGGSIGIAAAIPAIRIFAAVRIV